ncbi:E3 ubiquitin-protein ligase TRIM56-like [Ambystoma mexicanum]|uniref:E3 ubiquitin-protein ligase TRIM56-like n=1 Tax=Ambystoma mexicanum TaxID=8296 RepID=UPI0037E8CF24
MAQKSTSLSDLVREDYLSCKICFELYRTPKLLPCLHTYCEQCLEQMVTDGFLQCPECRVMVEVNDGANNLKTNFFINSLLEVFQPRQTKDLECSVCATLQKHLPATSRCLDCHDFLCQSCALGHGCSRATLSHRVVDVKEFLDGMHDTKVRSLQEIFCLGHRQEPLRFFCETCNAPICRDCRLLDHFQHQVLSMADAIIKKKPEVNKLIKDLESNICRISQWKKEVTGSLESLSQATEAIKGRITSYIDEATALLQNQKEDAFKELDNFLKQESSALYLVKGELHNQYDQAVSTKEFSQKVMDVGNDSEILSMEETMRERMQKLQSFSPQNLTARIPELVLGGTTILPQIQFFKLMFPGQMHTDEMKMEACSVADSATCSLVSKGASGSPKASGYQPMEERFKDLQLEDSQSETSECESLNLVSTFDLAQDDDEYISKITGIAAFPGAGGILLVDQGNKDIKRFSMSGDLRRTITLEDDDLSPCSITVCGNTLACSAENYLIFMTLGGSFLHKLKLRSLQDDPQYAIASYGSQYVAVSEGTLCSVSLYNTKGQCLERLKPQGYQGTKFLFIAINSHEDFIVCDVAKHEIVIFERSGAVINTLDSSNSPFSRPFSLCLDSSNHIFVIDKGRVIKFSEDGEDGQVVLRIEPGQSNPRMIVIDSNGRLVLVHQDNYVRYYEFPIVIW